MTPALLHAHLHLMFGLSVLLKGVSQRQCMVLSPRSTGMQHDMLTEVTMLQVYALMKVRMAGMLCELVHARLDSESVHLSDSFASVQQAVIQHAYVQGVL